MVLYWSYSSHNGCRYGRAFEVYSAKWIFAKWRAKNFGRLFSLFGAPNEGQYSSAPTIPFTLRRSVSMYRQGWSNPGRRPFGRLSFVRMVATDVCGPWVWGLLHVSDLEPRILRQLLNFCIICAVLLVTVTRCTACHNDETWITPASDSGSQNVVP